MYNSDLSRLTSKIENISSATKALYEKHKNDFKDKNSYYSDLNFELANAYHSFGNYRKFFQHFKLSIEKNPWIIKRYFRISSLALTQNCYSCSYWNSVVFLGSFYNCLYLLHMYKF